MRISEAQRWQIIDMHTTGISFKAIGRQMSYHYKSILYIMVTPVLAHLFNGTLFLL
jgi:hypothetical protein